MIKAYHIHRPNVVFEVDCLDYKNIDDKNYLTKSPDGDILLYGQFIITDGAPVDNTYHTNYSDVWPVENIDRIIVQKNGQTEEISEEIDLTNIYISLPNENVMYGDYPIITINSEYIGTKTLSQKQTLLEFVYGILPNIKTKDTVVITDTEPLITATFLNVSGEYQEKFTFTEFSEVLDTLSYRNEEIHYDLREDTTLIKIEDEEINPHDFSKTYKIKNREVSYD